MCCAYERESCPLLSTQSRRADVSRETMQPRMAASGSVDQCIHA